MFPTRRAALVGRSVKQSIKQSVNLRIPWVGVELGGLAGEVVGLGGEIDSTAQKTQVIG